MFEKGFVVVKIQNGSRVEVQLPADAGGQTTVENRSFVGIELIGFKSLQLPNRHFEVHRQNRHMNARLESGLTQQLTGRQDRRGLRFGMAGHAITPGLRVMDSVPKAQHAVGPCGTELGCGPSHRRPTAHRQRQCHHPGFCAPW